MATNKTLTINNVDFAPYVERDSYITSLIPVQGESVTTMDGVEHVTIIRHKGQVTFSLNPLTSDQLQTLMEALMDSPMSVSYSCLQRNETVSAYMVVDNMSAQFLSRCLYLNKQWNQPTDITLTEL